MSLNVLWFVFRTSNFVLKNAYFVLYYKANGMPIIFAWVIVALVSPFLNSGLCFFMAKVNAGNNVKIFFTNYVNLLLLTVVVACFLSCFEKDFVMLSVAYGTGCILKTFISGPKYFVSCTLSQQEVTIQCITSRFTKKTFVLPVEQITNAKLSPGRRWYNFPQVYTITVNDEEGKFYLLNPINSNDYFYLINNEDVNALKPAGE